MELVVDSNVLFSALIKEGMTAELFLDENLHLFAPEFLLDEFLKHKEMVLAKTKRTEREFFEILGIFTQTMAIIPREEFYEFLDEALEISPDENDVPFIALALRLNCPLWSNDKKLKEQTRVPVYSTTELAALFSHP